MKIIYKIFTFVFLTTIFLIWGSLSFASCTSLDGSESYSNYEQYACTAAGYKWVADTDGGTVSLPNPLTGKTSYTESSEGIPSLLGKIINAVLGLVGSLALVMFIYGGITWMTSVGNQEQVTKGKNIIIWAAIGLVIIFMSYAMVKFVIESMASK